MIHPLNTSGIPWIETKTGLGTRRVSIRKYRIATSYDGVHRLLIGKTVRLCSLGNKEPGEHTETYAAVIPDFNLEREFAIGIPYVDLEPISD